MTKQPLKKSKIASNSVMEANVFGTDKLKNKKSKLETYVELLNILAHPRQIESANSNCTETKLNELSEYTPAIDYLAEQGLVKKRVLSKATIYTTTSRGLSILKYFNVTKNMPQPIADRAKF